MDSDPNAGCYPKIPWVMSYTLLAIFPFMLHFILLRHPYEHPELYSPYYGPFFYWFIMCNYVYAMSHFVAARLHNPGTCYQYHVALTQLLADGGTCEKCNFRRVNRSHHCSACKFCSTRMDHHCVWIDNCMGSRNYKFFIAFLSCAWVRDK